MLGLDALRLMDHRFPAAVMAAELRRTRQSVALGLLLDVARPQWDHLLRVLDTGRVSLVRVHVANAMRPHRGQLTAAICDGRCDGALHQRAALLTMLAAAYPQLLLVVSPLLADSSAGAGEAWVYVASIVKAYLGRDCILASTTRTRTPRVVREGQTSTGIFHRAFSLVGEDALKLPETVLRAVRIAGRKKFYGLLWSGCLGRANDSTPLATEEGLRRLISLCR